MAHIPNELHRKISQFTAEKSTYVDTRKWFAVFSESGCHRCVCFNCDFELPDSIFLFCLRSASTAGWDTMHGRDSCCVLTYTACTHGLLFTWYYRIHCLLPRTSWLGYVEDEHISSLLNQDTLKLNKQDTFCCLKSHFCAPKIRTPLIRTPH